MTRRVPPPSPPGFGNVTGLRDDINGGGGGRWGGRVPASLIFYVHNHIRLPQGGGEQGVAYNTE